MTTVVRKPVIPNSQVFYFGYSKKDKTYFFRKADGTKKDRTVKLLENTDKSIFITDRTKNPKDIFTYRRIEIKLLESLKVGTNNKFKIGKYIEIDALTKTDGRYSVSNINTNNKLVYESIDMETNTALNKALLERIKTALFPFVSIEIREQDDLLFKKDLLSLQSQNEINITQDKDETFEFKLEIDSITNEMPIDSLFVEDVFTSNTIEVTQGETKDILQVSNQKYIAFDCNETDEIIFPMQIIVSGMLTTPKGEKNQASK